MDCVEARFLDTITVVGKSEPVTVYELMALKGGLTQAEEELRRLFDAGVQAYLAMEWDRAIEKFEESQKIERFPDGKTTPSLVYIERCRVFKENPPAAEGEKWDGVYRLTQK